MEGMRYQDWTKRRGERAARSRGSDRRKGTRVELAPREKRRLLQLLVCTALFAVVLVGKGIFPQRMAEAREILGDILRADTDFVAAFTVLGQSLENGEPVVETLGGLWSEIFAQDGLTPAKETTGGALAAAAAERLSRGEAWTAALLLEGDWESGGNAEPEPFAATASSAAPAAEEAAEPAVVHVDYDGPALPANTTMDRYALGLSETVSPVVGWVSSPFGWREHPVYGEEKFHNGVDLAVNTGTPIGAFAAGTVEYIGDSPEEYGLYLQIDHGNGVKSFYAHCSQLLVRQGQTVAAGETVALAGETGNATGPHLHLEVKYQGVRLNPVYYIETN